MKIKDEIKAVMGLTQGEMAMLLGISESQWSMYKSSQRDLPLVAKLRLFSLMREVKNTKEVADDAKLFLKTEEKKMQKQLNRELETIKLKRYRLQNEIEILENQRSECFAALVTAALIEKGVDEVDSTLASLIQGRVKIMLDKPGMHKLELTKFKLENLDILEDKIIQRLKFVE